jgi:hypothetical protein
MNQFAEYGIPDTKLQDCCKKAIEDLEPLGIDAATNEQTLMQWNRIFRQHEKFPYPTSQKRLQPEFFDRFPEAKESILEFAYGNLADLTTESLRLYIVNTLIPELVRSANLPVGSEELNLLQRFTNSPPSETTIWRWLKWFGFRYDGRKKTYYVDGHEKPSQRFHRLQFAEEYLKIIEPRCHRWIQLPETEVQELIQDETLEEKYLIASYSYDDEQGIKHLEFHVDTCGFLHEEANRRYPYGGMLSVRRDKNKNAIVVLGQDESVFHQYCLRTRQWVGPNGARPLLPKSDGYGLMVSAFQSREFGFGMKMSERDLEIVNEHRRGKKYTDSAAALEILRCDDKKDLSESPFVRYLEIGVNNEGWWDYNQMILQLEDCVDCLKTLYPAIDFIFLFDHSSGHAKKRIGGLDASAMNKGFGGAQPSMRETIIKAEDGYLGPFPRVVNIGDALRFDFQESDDGPFWLSEEEKLSQKFDRIVGGERQVDKTKADLARELSQGQIHVIDPRKYKLVRLQEMARERNIDLKRNETSKKEGWVGKQKGLLQVLWERGWIDESNLHEYQVLRKDDEGEVIDDFSLDVLMASCLDFADEITEMEARGETMGIRVVSTTKFHAELAGEGIEYAWACAKGWYRAQPLNSKKTKNSFHELVKKTCLGRDKMTTERVRAFSKRARSYICAYYAFETSSKEGIDNGECAAGGQKMSPLGYGKIEQMVKKFRTHRCALDFDRGFINGILKDIDD